MKRSLPVSFVLQITASFSSICCWADNFIARAARVPREASADSSAGNDHFNIRKDEIVICHLLEEVGDREFVLMRPYLLADSFNDRHNLSLKSP